MYGAPAVHPPNRPNKPRRSPYNVPTERQVDFDSRVRYHYRPEGGAIREISAKINTDLRQQIRQVFDEQEGIAENVAREQGN